MARWAIIDGGPGLFPAKLFGLDAAIQADAIITARVGGEAIQVARDLGKIEENWNGYYAVDITEILRIVSTQQLSKLRSMAGRGM